MRRLPLALLGVLIALAAHAGPAAAIIGGTATSEPSWPWGVQVLTADGGGSYGSCGGTLVTSTRVVTTGSCVKGKSKSEIFVVANQKHYAQDGDASGFQCSFKKKKARKKSSFKPCSSPKTYGDLTPGGYAFEVRASGAAGPDSSPAKKTFTIASG